MASSTTESPKVNPEAESKEEDIKNDNSNEDENTSSRAFECNICLDTASDAVISMCGHLFCWPCLHQWLETRPQRQICPVCKVCIECINRINEKISKTG